MDENGISMESLRESGADVIHVSPEHHYPLGTVMSAARRQELLNWAVEKEGRYVIEDDYDCEFRYRSRSIPALKSMDRNGRVIYEYFQQNSGSCDPDQLHGTAGSADQPIY